MRCAQTLVALASALGAWGCGGKDGVDARADVGGDVARDGGILDAGAPPQEGGASRSPIGESRVRKRVFVTADQWKGDLRAAANSENGFEGGDALCQIAAENARLGGQWRAFLSGKVRGRTIHAIDRVADHAYYLLDSETLVFDDKLRMSADALAAIRTTERGPLGQAEAYVWTGTRDGAYRAPACEDPSGEESWSSADLACHGGAGWTAAATSWCFAFDPMSDGHPCAFPASLYCFEQ